MTMAAVVMASSPRSKRRASTSGNTPGRLSACETGLGETKPGDGVYGLRRALVMAGAESQVMSLWQVSDDATRALMTAYYARLKAGEGRSGALRQVQLEMLHSPTRQHPYFWASFILSGADGPIQFQLTTVAGATAAWPQSRLNPPANRSGQQLNRGRWHRNGLTIADRIDMSRPQRRPFRGFDTPLAYVPITFFAAAPASVSSITG